MSAPADHRAPAPVHERYRFRPGVAAGDLLFIAGHVGLDAHGRTRLEPEFQIRRAFENLGATLKRLGSGWDRLVRLTTCSTDLTAHFAMIRRIKADFVPTGFQAWAALGVSALASPELMFEANAVALRRPSEKA